MVIGRPDLREFYLQCKVDRPPDAVAALRWFVDLFHDGMALDANCLYGNGWLLGFSAIKTKEAIRQLEEEGLLEKVSPKMWVVSVASSSTASQDSAPSVGS